MEITEGLRQIDMVENPANTPAGNSYLTPEKLTQIKAMSEEAFSQLKTGMAEALSNGNINQADVEAVMWARTGDATLPAAPAYGIDTIPHWDGPGSLDQTPDGPKQDQAVGARGRMNVSPSMRDGTGLAKALKAAASPWNLNPKEQRTWDHWDNYTPKTGAPPSAPQPVGQSLTGYPAMTDLTASGAGGGAPEEKGWQGFYPDDPLKKKALNNFFLDLAVQPTYGVGGLMQNVAKAAKSTQKYYETLVDKQKASQVAGAKTVLETRKTNAQIVKWVSEAEAAGTTGYLKEWDRAEGLLKSADPKKQNEGYRLAAGLAAKSGQMPDAQMFAEMADNMWTNPEAARELSEMALEAALRQKKLLEGTLAVEDKAKDIRNIQDVGGIKIIKR